MRKRFFQLYVCASLLVSGLSGNWAYHRFDKVSELEHRTYSQAGRVAGKIAGGGLLGVSLFAFSMTPFYNKLERKLNGGKKSD